MKTPEQYILDTVIFWGGEDPDAVTVLESEARQAVAAAIADAQAEADQRVAAAQRAADKYRTLLVTAILRSAQRTHPLETQAMNAAHPTG